MTMAKDSYFAKLGDALKAAGIAKPTMVIDLERLDANIDIVRRALPDTVPLRLVDKSLPSLELLSHIMQKTGTRLIMSFHLPVTLAVLDAFPHVEILYGKPLPVAALNRQFADLERDVLDRLMSQTVFLIDTVERLDAYAALAKVHQQTLRIAFEVDTGMHRGGFATAQALQEAVSLCAQSPSLKPEGIMGYEAHIAAIPGLFGGPSGESTKVRQRMADFASVLPPGARQILNTGGSKTAVTYGDPGIANEVSIGSGFLKPTDFDTPSLDALLPAAFVATPTLKVVDARLPGPHFVTRIAQAIGLFPKRGCFIYGGKWMAKPVFPEGMKTNGLWGLSSNQQFMALDEACVLRPDDHVFFRPTQSEAMLQYFGPISLYAGGKIIGEWAVLAPS
jgi:D-serine deaminase-like pyridoxal phosphate-dependent protein